MRFMLDGMLVHPRYCHLSRLESPMVFAAAPLALKVAATPLAPCRRPAAARTHASLRRMAC